LANSLIMKFTLTEFDKAILLGIFIVTKGKKGEKVKEKIILSKFPMRQRKNARIAINRLIRFGLLKKENDSYSLTEKGIKEAKKLLVEGAPIWGVTIQRV